MTAHSTAAKDKERKAKNNKGREKRKNRPWSVFLLGFFFVCGTASVLGNKKNKEEIFTLFVIIIVLYNIHIFIL